MHLPGLGSALARLSVINMSDNDIRRGKRLRTCTANEKTETVAEKMFEKSSVRHVVTGVAARRPLGWVTTTVRSRNISYGKIRSSVVPSIRIGGGYWPLTTANPRRFYNAFNAYNTYEREKKKKIIKRVLSRARALNNNNYMHVSRSVNTVCIWFDRYSGSRRKRKKFFFKLGTAITALYNGDDTKIWKNKKLVPFVYKFITHTHTHYPADIF